MANYKLEISKVFKTNTGKTFCRKSEGETLPKLFFIFKQLENCQNEYYFLTT